jgi:hypothetical protein
MNRQGKITQLYLTLVHQYIYLDGIPSPLAASINPIQKEALLQPSNLGRFAELQFDSHGFVTAGRVLDAFEVSR